MSGLTAHRDFLAHTRERQKLRDLTVPSEHSFITPPQTALEPGSKRLVTNYSPLEESVRNDYAGWYNISGTSGALYILGARPDEICAEYPTLRRLMEMKSRLVDTHAHPPLYLPLPLTASSPEELIACLSPARFDVILINPSGKSWAETANLPIRSLSADPGFVFLWVGRGDQEGLERGRECLARWGFRRAEDILCVRRGKQGKGFGRGGLLASQKEHCLMGIRGTVRRSTDNQFVHCNVDTDVIVRDSEDQDPLPRYLYTLIESFCLGTRRLQLFTGVSSARHGWVTATTGFRPAYTEPWSAGTYEAILPPKQDGRYILPFIDEIEALRPKSPVKGARRNQSTNPAPSRGGPARGQLGRYNTSTTRRNMPQWQGTHGQGQGYNPYWRDTAAAGPSHNFPNPTEYHAQYPYAAEQYPAAPFPNYPQVAYQAPLPPQGMGGGHGLADATAALLAAQMASTHLTSAYSAFPNPYSPHNPYAAHYPYSQPPASGDPYSYHTFTPPVDGRPQDRARHTPGDFLPSWNPYANQ